MINCIGCRFTAKDYEPKKIDLECWRIRRHCMLMVHDSSNSKLRGIWKTRRS